MRNKCSRSSRESEYTCTILRARDGVLSTPLNAASFSRTRTRSESRAYRARPDQPNLSFFQNQYKKHVHTSPPKLYTQQGARSSQMKRKRDQEPQPDALSHRSDGQVKTRHRRKQGPKPSTQGPRESSVEMLLQKKHVLNNTCRPMPSQTKTRFQTSPTIDTEDSFSGNPHNH
jgi:hypothetical protein